jgi:hypothetical protein
MLVHRIIGSATHRSRTSTNCTTMSVLHLLYTTQKKLNTAQNKFNTTQQKKRKKKEKRKKKT